jgi:hypothetical protein
MRRDGAETRWRDQSYPHDTYWRLATDGLAVVVENEAALRLDRVRERVVPAIATAFPATQVRFDLSRLEGLGYYRGLAFRISVEGPAGSLPVVDGGVVPWMQALLADRKERLVASAIGTEAVCKVCPPEPKLGR